MTEPICLGPFDLLQPVGKGGMGVIWTAVHRVQRVRVAVKVLTLDRAQEESFRMAFRKEVRSIAGLDHPNIVYVYDYGEVSAEVERSSGGRIAAGTPYLAMELVHGGSLSQRKGNVPWRELRDTLLDLLGALAHAHARGVIHRDIKPGNVLVQRDGSIKLTDFGLAHALDPEGPGDDEAPRGGTPAYMAPEQLQASWRDYGPWTDLYAVGCLAWSMATGGPPFRSESWPEVMQGHLADDPPAFDARVAVVEGFEDWLRTLLRKDPRHRFRRAADAAWALLALGDRVVTPPLPLAAAPTTTPGEVSRAGPRTTLFWSEPDMPAPPRRVAAPPREGTHAPPPSVAVPPLPASWRRLERPYRLPLIGTGLGLYGLRAVSLVGREREQDRLWAELGRLAQDRMRLVILQGPVGCGKSRLAEWLCERAHEVGAATVLKASWDPVWGHADGLGGMISAHLGCVGLAADELVVRLAELLSEQGVRDPYEWEALTELIAPGVGPGRVRLTSASQRYVLVQRFLLRLCGERPVVLWLDDVPRSADALGFAEHLLANASDLPVLLLLTARDGAWPGRAADPVQYRTLLSSDAASAILLGNLAPVHASALVRELLGLEGELADQVEARAAGNPMFTVQLVGDWVNRGLLEPTDRGFRLRKGVAIDLPDDLHTLWTSTVRDLLRDEPPASQIALEIAAALGLEVNAREWEVATALAGCPRTARLADLLVRSRHMEHTDSGYRFAHAMLRESLERSAREAGRWEAHNQVCAQMLRDRPPGALHLAAARLGRHLLEGGNTDEGLELLVQGARTHVGASEYREAAVLLDRRDIALDAMGIEESDPRRVKGWLLRAEVYLRQGRPHLASVWAKRAGEAADGTALRARALCRVADTCAQLGQADTAERNYLAGLELFREASDQAGIVDCLLGLGQLALKRGRPARARELFVEARALHLGPAVTAAGEPGPAERGPATPAEPPTPLQLAECLDGLAQAARDLGALDEAEALARESCARFQALGNLSGVGASRWNLAGMALIRGDHPRARAEVEAAMRLFEHAGDLAGQLRCHNFAAEILRFEGNLDAAEAAYRRALDLAGTQALDIRIIPTLNLALVVLHRHHYREARARLEEVLEEAERHGRRALMAGIHVALMTCAVGTGDLSAFTIHFKECRALLDDSGIVELDIAWPAELCAELLWQAGQPAWARAAAELALQQWLGLGREEDAARVRAFLRARQP